MVTFWCHNTLFFDLVCKVVVKVQSSSILFAYMGEPHEKNNRGKLLFWFCLQGGCGVSKRVVFFSRASIGHMDRNLEVNFWFDLVCKAVMKVQRSFIVFIYMGAPHVQKN